MQTFKQLLVKLKACSEAREWAGDMPIEEIVAKCHRGDWLLWLAKRVDVDNRKMSLAKGLCANTVRHLMKDERSIAVVDAAIAYGNHEITIEQLCDAVYAAAHVVAADAAAAAADAAADAAHAAYTRAAHAVAADAADAADAAADAAAAAAYGAAYGDAYAAAADTAAAAVYAAAYAAAAAADAAYAARNQNRLQTAELCRQVLGDLIIKNVKQELDKR